jgi:glycosyltransferase involved in cell wall biosynthesis
MFNALSNDIGVFQDGSGWARVIRMYERLIMRLPDMVIASTEEQKKFFVTKLKVSPSKITVFYLAADDTIYFPSKTRSRSKTFKAVYYGLFTPLHGVDFLLDAALLCKKETNIQFHLYGRGMLLDKIKQRIVAEDITNVVLRDDIHEKNARPFLQKADIFFGFLGENSTIDREIPNKVYQGIALGKAVITTESIAIRGKFHPGKDIVLVPPGNAKLLASEIIKLFKNTKRTASIGGNALSLYQQHFTPYVIGLQMRECFSHLVSREIGQNIRVRGNDRVTIPAIASIDREDYLI